MKKTNYLFTVKLYKCIAIITLFLFGEIQLFAQEFYEKAFLNDVNTILNTINTKKPSAHFTESGIEDKNTLLYWYEFKNPLINTETKTIIIEGWNKEIQIPYSNKKNDLVNKLVEKLEKHCFKPMTDFNKDNFYLAKGDTDTLYLVRDKEFEQEFGDEMEIVFKSEKEALHFLDQQYLQSEDFTVGYTERKYEYKMQINKKEKNYYSKRPISIADYKDFCIVKEKSLSHVINEFNKKNAELSFPVSFSKNYLSFYDLEEYCFFLSELWGIPVNYFESVKEHGYYKIAVTESDWRRKEFLDKITEYINQIYGKEKPVYFEYSYVYNSSNSFQWADIKNMKVNRNENIVIIETYSGENITFNFTEEQYTDIASMHVHFLAFYEIMSNETSSFE